MGDVNASLTAGVSAGGYRRGTTTADRWDQYVIPIEDRQVAYRGRAASFRIPGIAGTTGQRLASIFNAAGSSVIVDVIGLYYDVAQTAARVVEPPIVRTHRIAAAATGGSTMTKAPEDTTMTSSASVELRQGASAEKTAATLTATLGSILTQEVAPRALTLVGYEQFDRASFFEDSPVTLRAGEGLCLNLDYTVATSSPVTDMGLVTIKWIEYTRP